jgi:hypothetical protein
MNSASDTIPLFNKRASTAELPLRTRKVKNTSFYPLCKTKVVPSSTTLVFQRCHDPEIKRYASWN